MPIITNDAGFTYRVTATGTIAIVNKASATGVSPGNVAVIGIYAQATAGATCATIQLFATATATATAAPLTSVIVWASGTPNYFPVPVNSASGLGAIVTNGNNVDLTIFWKPV